MPGPRRWRAAQRALALVGALAITLCVLAASAYATPGSDRARATIYGGGVDRQAGVGWVAALMQHPSVARGDRFDRQFCAGSLVAARWVLTAAHCVVEEGAVRSPRSLQVLVGEKDLGSARGQVADVTRVVVLRGYNEDSYFHDAALLQLSAPVTVAPVRMATPADSALYSPGRLSYIAGWGDRRRDDAPQSSYPRQLYSAFIPVRPNADCRRAWGTRFRVNSMFCAGFGRPDTCKGDSGGPIAVRLPRNRWRLTGVTSFGRCGLPRYIGVYTRVSAFQTWVRNTMAARR